MAATQPSRRRRRAAVLPAGLAAAIAAIALLVAGTVGAMVVLGDGDPLVGAVLDETFQPAPSHGCRGRRDAVAHPITSARGGPCPDDPEREPEPHDSRTDSHSCAGRAAESEGDGTSYGEAHAAPSEGHCWGTGARPG